MAWHPITFSVYSDRFEGRATASRSRFSQSIATAASNDVPLGSLVRIRHGDRQIDIPVTDRMHRRFTGKRMDLSRAAWNHISRKAPPGLRKGHYTILRRGHAPTVKRRGG